ncbi:U4/U6 X U5 tri-snRNP complex subunit Prp4 family protein [Schizosaccharomyces japonicus yFS275]|uniref:U4/U6 X U5 tri-snRNP complex subunit Prp4 family protein n=1 Tax=Schizosaccharomyces japonicus (strain yFS275 / FY16936) TaxID=402676 RepID=B6JVW5_SCHJY|nr:U4/U6 X U5 tri-snRNP complex subunit Prp4 family protein [Schizosaccharomyces japonicus yFS275]EEB05516.1 U4/U6 X U5 tri-snRNP complex subunit Prp4 family protein [Schizosaccharomyces japonicus yFS275]
MNQQIGLEDLETRAFTEGRTRATKEQAAYFAEKERETRLAELKVPVEDVGVREALRALKQPVTLFGENALDRRLRLQQLMYEAAEKAGFPRTTTESPAESMDVDAESESYIRGTPELLETRKWLLRDSLQRASRRLAAERVRFAEPASEKLVAHRDAVDVWRKVEPVASQVVGERPTSVVRLTGDAKMFASGNWSGQVKIWDTTSMSEQRLYRGHTDRVSGVDWHPAVSSWDSNSERVCLASGAADNLVCLWSGASATPLRVLRGHLARVGRVAFHPGGTLLASASYDTTWRMWDVEQGTELLMQEGHAEGVASVAWQGDGSLLASGGLDAIGRVWDVRTGQSVMVLDAHASAIVCMDWAPNGYQLVTGSVDDTARVWDVRKVTQSCMIPAHKSLVSDVRFVRGAEYEAACLVTSGYDGHVRVWDTLDWSLVHDFEIPESKVMSVDASIVDKKRGPVLVSSGFDRTARLFTGEFA